jgi:hypothetical protein
MGGGACVLSISVGVYFWAFVGFWRIAIVAVIE